MKLTCAKQFVVSKIFWGPKHFLDAEHNLGAKFFWVKLFAPLGVKIFTLKILLSPRFFKIFGSEKLFWSEKKLDKKNFVGKKIFLGPKNFGQKKNLVKKRFWAWKKFSVKNKFFWSKKLFCLKTIFESQIKIWVHKKFGEEKKF